MKKLDYHLSKLPVSRGMRRGLLDELWMENYIVGYEDEAMMGSAGCGEVVV